mgnify:CR=1 FL=1
MISDKAFQFFTFSCDDSETDVIRFGQALAKEVLADSRNAAWLEAAHRMDVDPTEHNAELLATMICDAASG